MRHATADVIYVTLQDAVYVYSIRHVLHTMLDAIVTPFASTLDTL